MAEEKYEEERIQEDVNLDEKMAEHDRFLMALPPSVRKFYEQPARRKSKKKKAREEYVLQPIKRPLEVIYMYRKVCPHCEAFMKTTTYAAIVRYLWARGIRFSSMDLDEGDALNSLANEIAFPDPKGFGIELVPAFLIRTENDSIYMPVDLNEVKAKPLAIFYKIQQAVEGRIAVPLISMGINLRRSSRRDYADDPPPDLFEVSEPSRRGGGAEIPAVEAPPPSAEADYGAGIGEVSPCEKQPRC